MRLTRNLLALALSTFVFGVSVVVAGPIVRKDKGASNNGVGLSFATCSLITNTENCGAYSSTPFETVDGANVFQFVTNDGQGTADSVQLFDVFTLPTPIVAGSELTLNLNNINDAYGDFACNNTTDPTAGAVDSLGNPLSGPCTVGLTTSLASFLSETDSGNTATIDFSGAGLPSSWTFYTADGNLDSFSVGTGSGTSTPEPGSASLLIVGVLALGLVAAKSHR